MNTTMQKQLEKELRAVGAQPAEIEGLLPVASKLGILRHSEESAAAKKPKRWLMIARPVVYIASGFVAGMLLIVVAQTAVPSSWLYPIQKSSDSVAITMYPAYRATVMMKRAQQVKQLVADKADSKVILATLADYQTEASAYKATTSNYAAFEYCKSNLQQAATLASGPERQAINDTLSALKDI